MVDTHQAGTPKWWKHALQRAEVRVCLACLNNSEEADMAGAKQAWLEKVEDEIRAVREGEMEGDLRVLVMMLAHL